VIDRLIAEPERIQRWLHERSRLPIQRDFIGIAREIDGRIVAAFGFDSFQDESCALHTCTDSQSGYNRSLLYQVFEVVFEQWAFKRLYAIIQTKNAKSLNLADRLGFIEIGHTDDLWFGVLEKKNCRWLRPAEKQHHVRRRRSGT
jgi:RimJ/RimL family protein N-acetyltransferase